MKRRGGGCKNDCGGIAGGACGGIAGGACGSIAGGTCGGIAGGTCGGIAEGACAGIGGTACEGIRGGACEGIRGGACEDVGSGACGRIEGGACGRIGGGACTLFGNGACGGAEDNVCGGTENGACRDIGGICIPWPEIKFCGGTNEVVGDIGGCRVLERKALGDTGRDVCRDPGRDVLRDTDRDAWLEYTIGFLPKSVLSKFLIRYDVKCSPSFRLIISDSVHSVGSSSCNVLNKAFVIGIPAFLSTQTPRCRRIVRSAKMSPLEPSLKSDSE